MAKIIIIAAVGKNLELGYNNDLIWHLKEDLKFFKEQTMGHKIVMGYNTFTSLPNVLPGREHIVLTHQEIANEKVKVYHDFNELLKYLNSLNEDIYIIGGASLYKLFIDIADNLLLTEIDATYEQADTYFPKFAKNNYQKEIIKEITENEIHYTHVCYRRVN